MYCQRKVHIYMRKSVQITEKVIHIHICTQI